MNYYYIRKESKSTIAETVHSWESKVNFAEGGNTTPDVIWDLKLSQREITFFLHDKEIELKLMTVNIPTQKVSE
jgi:hypothetical protein